MKVTLEKNDLLKTLEKVLGRSLDENNVTVTADPFSVEIKDLSIEDLVRVEATLSEPAVTASTPAAKPVGRAADTGPVTAEEMARIAEQNRRLAAEGGGAGPVPGGGGRTSVNSDIPEDFLPPGGSFDPPPPTDETGR